MTFWGQGVADHSIGFETMLLTPRSAGDPEERTILKSSIKQVLNPRCVYYRVSKG